jgi:hypothetical protein
MVGGRGGLHPAASFLFGWSLSGRSYLAGVFRFGSVQPSLRRPQNESECHIHDKQKIGYSHYEHLFRPQ